MPGSAAAPTPPAAPAVDTAGVVHVVDVKIVCIIVGIADQPVFLCGRISSIWVLGLNDFFSKVGVPAGVAAREPDQRFEILLAGHIEVNRLDGAGGPARGGGGGGGGTAGGHGSCWHDSDRRGLAEGGLAGKIRDYVLGFAKVDTGPFPLIKKRPRHDEVYNDVQFQEED